MVVIDPNIVYIIDCVVMLVSLLGKSFFINKALDVTGVHDYSVTVGNVKDVVISYITVEVLIKIFFGEVNLSETCELMVCYMDEPIILGVTMVYGNRSFFIMQKHSWAMVTLVIAMQGRKDVPDVL